MKSEYNITKEFLIDNLLNQKKTPKQISKELGCDQGTVAYHIRKNGIIYDRTRKNLLGRKFGFLEVLSKSYLCDEQHWECLCKCGNKSYPSTNSLLSGHSQSCGCKHEYKKFGKLHKLWGGYGDISGRFFSDIKRHAKTRNIEFKVTINEIWDIFLKQDKRCALTDLELYFDLKSSEFTGVASLDRIDNSKGYTKENVWWVHKDINIMKLNHDINYFIRLCGLVYKKNANN